MKKLILLLPILLFSLYPPIGFNIPMVSGGTWLWLVLLAGFAGIYTVFLNINIYVKIFSILTFISCFFSTAPSVSFTAYILLISCIYYYIFLIKYANWEIVKKLLTTILGLNILLYIMQLFGQDTLCNFFSRYSPVLAPPSSQWAKITRCFGSVGNSMQLNSFIWIIIAFLVSFIEGWKVRKKFIAILVVIIVFVYWQNKIRFGFGDVGTYAHCETYKQFNNFFIAIIDFRFKVWIEAIKLAFVHPVWGWGLSQFKTVFPALTMSYKFTQSEGQWLMAHNEFIQILFEGGILIFGVVIAYIVNLYIRLRRFHLTFPMISLSIIIFDMNNRYPLRHPTTVFILIAFFAYLERRILCQQNLKLLI